MKLYQNIMEDLVEEVLSTMDKRMDFCKCQRCHADIVAYALNHLPPQYAVSPSGISFSKVKNLRHQHQADIQKELVRAIMLVTEHPRHEPEDISAMEDTQK